MPDQFVDATEQHRFELRDGDRVAGFLDYELTADRIALVHTEVDPEFSGSGVGSRVVRGALDSARERGLAVLPYCSFVRDWIDRHRDYADLVTDPERFSL